MLLCPYNPNDCTRPNGTSPYAVSIVTSPSYREPINLIPVVDLSARRTNTFSTELRETSMLESSDVDNSPKSLVSFAICVRPLFGESITVDDLIEFIEVNRVFGAQLFFFYVDESVDPSVLRCIREYERLGVVESTPWKLPAELDKRIPEKGQYFTMIECVYRLMYRTKYLTITDIDEFIVPTRTDNWRSMLALIDAESKHGHGDRIASYSFRNRFFLPDAPVVKPTEQTLPANWSNRFRVLTKITGETKLYPWTERSKMMAPPERILVWHTHVILDHQVVPPGETNVYVDEKDAVMHHYRKHSIVSGDVANYTRMWHFTSKIVSSLRSGSNSTRIV